MAVALSFWIGWVLWYPNLHISVDMYCFKFVLYNIYISMNRLFDAVSLCRERLNQIIGVKSII